MFTESDQVALLLSLKLAGLTSAILLVACTPISLWLARSRSRLASVVEAVVSLPLVLPPTVLGFYLLTLLGPYGSLGRLFEAAGFSAPAFNFSGILIGSLVFSFPFVAQSLQGAFASVDERLIEAAQTLRCSPWAAFFQVVLPLSRRGYLAGGILAFAHTLGEFGVVLMIGGSIPGKTQTVSIAIFRHVETLDYRAAHMLSLTLVGLCFALLLALNAINRKRRER